VFQGAGILLDRQLGYEVTRYVFDRDAEARRRVRDDAQVAKALELLAGVNSQSELLARIEMPTRSSRN
jgi:hypothetical protein